MTPKITSIGNNVFRGCSSLIHFVVPESITNASNLGANMLNGASVQHMVFLGFTLSQIQQRIISTRFFGLGKDCKFQVKNDNKMYQYTSQTNSISTIDNNTREYNQKTLTSTQIDYNIPTGKYAKFSINRLYKYDTTLVAKFFKTTDNPTSPAIPMIVFYIDSTTSQKSREFIDTILKSPKFAKTIGNVTNTPNALYMVLDRASATEDQLDDFRRKFVSRDKAKSFPFVVVYYKEKGTIKTNSFQALFQ